MSERNAALTMPYSVRTLEIWIDRYGRLTRIERSGRLYEAVGIRGLYLVVARLFGEASLPTSRSAGAIAPHALTRFEIEERRDRTLYYEISNLVIFLVYLPLLAMAGALHSLLVCYAAVLCLLHGSLVLIERYKRALYGLCLQHHVFQANGAPCAVHSPGSGEKAEALPSARVTTKSSPLAIWYFLPHRFETDRFYRRIGMESVRQWVLTFTRLTTLPPEQRQRNPRSIPGTSIAHLLDFDHETRVSEASHLVGILLQLPFLALFVLRHAPLGVAYILALLYLNTSFVLLQRATRVRLWRVLSKRGVSRQ